MKAAIAISILVIISAIAPVTSLHSQAAIGVNGKPLAQSGTTTTVSCSANGGQEYLCNAVVCICIDQVSTFATGTVDWSSSGTGTFSPTSTCQIVDSSDTLANCEVYYAPSATDIGTQVTITATYSGDPENSGSSGTATISVTNQTSTSSSITSITSSIITTSVVLTTSTPSTTSQTASTTSSTTQSSSSSITTYAVVIIAIVVIILLILFFFIRRRSK